MPRAPTYNRIETIGQLAAAEPRWVWLSCNTADCGNAAAVPLVPLVIRWGAGAPRGWMLTRFRCLRCHARSTQITCPSRMGSHGPMPFPLERVLRTDPPLLKSGPENEGKNTGDA